VGRKGSTIGEDPLDAIIPEHRAKPTQDEAKNRANSEKERLTVHLTAELINRVRNAVYWTPGLTLSTLAENALERAVNDLEEQRGEPFPQRRGELKGGRPIK